MINRVIDGCFCPSQASFTHIETSLSVVNSYRSIDLVYSSKLTNWYCISNDLSACSKELNIRYLAYV